MGRSKSRVGIIYRLGYFMFFLLDLCNFHLLLPYNILTIDKFLQLQFSFSCHPTHRDFLFWLQFTGGATLDADTEISNIYPLAADYASSTGGYFVGAVEYYIDLDGNVGALQLISQDGGTETTTATWIKR